MAKDPRFDGEFGDEGARGKVVPAPQPKASSHPSVRRDIVMRDPAIPEAHGLYDPAREHDACGVGFVANMHNAKSHDIVRMGLEILLNLDHRGATGADPKAGDGCGMLVQIPHEFFVAKAKDAGFELPDLGDYAIGVMFLPKDEAARADIEAIVADTIAEEGCTLLGWRDVPVDPSGWVRASSRASRPHGRSSSPARRIAIRTRSSAGSSFCARPSRTRCSAARRSASPAITPCRCRRGRSSTRACCSPASWATTSRTCRTRCSPRPWPWSTSAFRQTRFPRGSSPTPTGTSRTTARSTRCAAT